MSDNSCIFCRIAEGEIPATVVYEDDEIVAFEDVNPQAPTHLLLIPRKHVPSLNSVGTDDGGWAARLILAAPQVAREAGVHQDGYRVVINTGSEGGQAVDHVHMHLLGGRRMTWPPG